MAETNFKGFVICTEAQYIDIEPKNEDTIYMVTDSNYSINVIYQGLKMTVQEAITKLAEKDTELANQLQAKQDQLTQEQLDSIANVNSKASIEYVDEQDLNTLNTSKAYADTKQNKLTSDNAGSNVTITETGGVIKINSIGGGGGGTSDHNALTNRDIADQHSIGAITGLEDELTSKANKTLDNVETQAFYAKGVESGLGNPVPEIQPTIELYITKLEADGTITLSATKPTDTITIPWTITTGNTQKVFKYTYQEDGVISALSKFKLVLYMDSIETNRIYTFSGQVFANVSGQNILVGGNVYTNQFTITNPRIEIPLENNVLPSNLSRKAGDYFEVDLNVTKSGGASDSTNIISSPILDSKLVRNGGDVGSVNIIDFNGVDTKTQSQRNREYEGENKSQNEEIKRLDEKNAEQDVKLSQLSNPNLLINGGFDIWQRGDVFNVTANSWLMTADRFSFFTEGGMIAQISHNENKYYRINITQAGGSSNLSYFFEESEIDEIVDIDLTVTIKLRANVSFIFGTYAFRGIEVYEPKNNQVVGDMKFRDYTATLKLKKTGIAGANMLQLLRMLTFEIEGIIDIAYVKLEKGEVATPFIRKPYSEELLNCGRYYQKFSYNNLSTIAIANFNTTWFTIQLPLLTEMRVKNPTIKVDGTIRRVDNGQNIPTLSGCTASLSSVAIGGAYTGTPTTTYIFSSGISHIALDAEIY